MTSVLHYELQLGRRCPQDALVHLKNLCKQSHTHPKWPVFPQFSGWKSDVWHAQKFQMHLFIMCEIMRSCYFIGMFLFGRLSERCARWQRWPWSSKVRLCWGMERLSQLNPGGGCSLIEEQAHRTELTEKSRQGHFPNASEASRQKVNNNNNYFKSERRRFWYKMHKFFFSLWSDDSLICFASVRLSLYSAGHVGLRCFFNSQPIHLLSDGHWQFLKKKFSCSVSALVKNHMLRKNIFQINVNSVKSSFAIQLYRCLCYLRPLLLFKVT